MLGEKARWEQRKNAECCFEQILGVTPNEIIAIHIPSCKISKKSKQDMLHMAGKARMNS